MHFIIIGSNFTVYTKHIDGKIRIYNSEFANKQVQRLKP